MHFKSIPVGFWALKKSNIKPYPKGVIHVFSLCLRTIRGSINHLYVIKYRYFLLQIHSCKTLSFLKKRLYVFFSQHPRTIRGSSNYSFASTELILDYIPDPLDNKICWLLRLKKYYISWIVISSPWKVHLEPECIEPGAFLTPTSVPY